MRDKQTFYIPRTFTSFVIISQKTYFINEHIASLQNHSLTATTPS